MLLLLVTCSLICSCHARIFSGSSFGYGAVVDRTCLGDYVGFDGNLFILARDNSVIWNLNLPINGQSVLFFQADGELLCSSGLELFFRQWSHFNAPTQAISSSYSMVLSDGMLASVIPLGRRSSLICRSIL